MIFADQGRVCIELTDHELRWLWYSLKGREKESFAPIHFEITPLPKGLIKQGRVLHPEALQSILKGYIEKARLDFKLHRKPRISIGLPLQNQFIREYSLPWIKKRSRPGLLRYLAEEEIPIPKEELLYDYFLVEQKGTPQRLKVTLAGIRESVLLPVIFCFEKAGFEIERVSFAQLGWGKVLDFDSEGNTLLLREDEGQIQYIFYKGAIPEIIRNFPTTVQSYGDEEWNDELHRMLLYLSSLHEQVDLGRIFWGKGDMPEKIGIRIGEYLQGVRGKVPVLQGVEEAFQSNWGSESLKAILPNEPEKCLTVLGMALEDDRYSLNNFWRTENLRKKEQRLKWLAAVAMLAISIGGGGMLVSSEQNLDTLRIEVEQLREVKSAQDFEEEQEAVYLHTWEVITGETTAVGQALKELTVYATKGIYLERIEIKDRMIAIQGLAAESFEVQKVFQQLKALGWGKVQLARYQIAEESLREGMPIQFILKAEQP